MLFLLCLIAPFRQLRSLLAVTTILAGLQALTLTAAAEGMVTELHALPAFFDSSVAALIVLLAIGNLAVPSLRRRWFIGALIGAMGGFGIGHQVTHLWQFAGSHALASIVSFK